MEIHDNRIKNSSLKKIKKWFGLKKAIKTLFIFIAFIGFGFGCIVYGAYLNKTAQTSVLKMFLIRLSEFDFSFIPKSIKSQAVEINEFTIDVNFKNWEKIRYLRERALVSGRISEETEEDVPARIRFQNHTYKVSISLTGMTGEHIRHPYKWSLAVNVKGGETILGMKKFALLIPQSRGYLTDWIATKILQAKGIVGLRNDFVNVSINGKNRGIYYLEERYDKRLIESNENREGIIFRADDFGSGIKVYESKKISSNPELTAQLSRLKKVWQYFLVGEIEANKIFDIEKFASIYAVSDIMNQKHALFFMNMRLYFNPITSLIEPIGREWGYLRNETYTNPTISIGNPITHEQKAVQEHEILKMLIDSYDFQKEYLKQMDQLTKRSFLDSVINNNSKELNILLQRIHLQNPFYKFPVELLYQNQEFLRKKLYSNLPYVNINFESVDPDSLVLNVKNVTDLPVQIHSISYNGNLMYLGKKSIIKPNYKLNTTDSQLKAKVPSYIKPDSFSIDSLEVSYSILGINHIKTAIVFPKDITQSDISKLNLVKQETDFSKLSFLKVDRKNKKIVFSKGLCTVNTNIVIPQGYTVTAEQNCSIDIINSSRIISYSPIRFYGQEKSKIIIKSSDLTGQGIVVFNCDSMSEIVHVNFSNLSNIQDYGWDLRGAITFYNSPVTIENCLFEDNLRGDDYLNIVKSDFTISNSTFKNSLADAFDSDFSEGSIYDVTFINSGNDAIDVSGTKLFLENIEILSTADKSISAGEDSHIKCKQIKIEGGEIAVTSKDKSTVEIDGLTIEGSKLAYTAFTKKPEFGPGVIMIKNASVENVLTDHLIQTGSLLIIDGKEIKGTIENVEKLLYGNEYGKASVR